MSDNFYRQKWDRPYLTPSIAVTLLEKTPHHAKLECPFYGPVQREPSDAMIEGSIVDGLVLGRGPDVTVIYVDSYSTKHAQALRDGTKEAGRMPIKVADWRRCKQAAEDLTRQIKHQSPAAALALSCGTKKKRIFWESRGVYCSTEPDIYNFQVDGVFDLKRTKIVPTERNWRRHVGTMNYHIQAAAALEGTGADMFGWIVVEASQPHCAVVHLATPELIRIGQRDWDCAKDIWANCVETGVFPAYESGEIDPMPYLLGDDDEIKFTEETGEAA